MGGKACSSAIVELRKTHREVDDSRARAKSTSVLHQSYYLLTMRVILALAFGLGAASALKEGRKYYETKVRFSRA